MLADSLVSRTASISVGCEKSTMITLGVSLPSMAVDTERTRESRELTRVFKKSVGYDDCEEEGTTMESST